MPDINVNPSEFRRRAEDLIAEGSRFLTDTSSLSSDDLKTLVQELKVHQIAFELENECLRETRALLQKLEQTYRSLFDFTPLGYLTLDPKGYVMEANLSAVTMLGSAEANLIGFSIQRFLSHEDANDLYFKLASISKKSHKLKWDARVVKGDGGHFDARLYCMLSP
jgi:PAS domain S-box-containing protein